MRKKRRKSKHKLLLERARPLYDQLAEFQGGERCAICGALPRSRKLDIDHCHATIKVRGLLCHRCNRALPAWITPEWLREAALYLEQKPIELDLMAPPSGGA